MRLGGTTTEALALSALTFFANAMHIMMLAEEVAPPISPRRTPRLVPETPEVVWRPSCRKFDIDTSQHLVSSPPAGGVAFSSAEIWH